MARTTHNWVTQGTVGIVPEAVLPTDPVPLSQAGGSDIIWVAQSGRFDDTRTNPINWVWDGIYADDFTRTYPVNVPYKMRLKQVGWHFNGYPLDIYRAGQKVGTIQPNSATKFNLLYQYNTSMWLRKQTQSRLPFSWTLTMKWQLEVMTAPEDVQPVPAPVPGGAPQDLITDAINVKHTQQSDPEIVERPGNRWISWIRRKWR